MHHQPPASRDPDEDNDRVWEVLDQARKTPIRLRFTDDVMRALREERHAQASKPTWWHALFGTALRPAWAVLTLGGLVGGSWLLLSQPKPVIVQKTTSIEQIETTVSEEIVRFIESDLAMLDEIDSLLTPQSEYDLSDADVELLLF